MITLLRSAAVLVALALPALGAQSASAATLRGDYQFAGTNASSCCGAPLLTDLGGNSFVQDTVGGSSQTVLAFPLSSGVELQSGVIPEDSYSIAALVRFDEITGYRRIVDISSASADRGLYERSGQLYYWPITGGSVTPPPFEINKYVHVVLTRDAATKRMVAYADGVEQLAFDDTTDAGVFAPGSPVRFFKDDQIITGEESAGAVARIRVYEAR